MPVEIPQPVERVMSEYIALVHAAAPGLLRGVYLHGSLALGAYDPGLSDIDFIAVTSRRCAATDLARLEAVHQAIARRHLDAQLSGSYLLWHEVGQSEAAIAPHPHFHDNVFHPSGHHDINAVTWCVLRQSGVALLGQPPEDFDIHVDWDDLISNMHHNLNTYWASFTTKPQRVLWLLDDYGIQWTVLGVLRQFYTFRERAITSKMGAGMYGLVHTPSRWHRLIHEALNIRARVDGSLYQSRIARALSAYTFLQLIITACNPAAVDGAAGD
jgi:hypothetical protein